ncbi:MAG: hypothetical protein KME46_15925 [Brasilonema angustatum HA4187-MV1]|jgi:hypothetical protein|nr:hypothetical protein [Brasilonema angustatum HA4187-MV1]
MSDTTDNFHAKQLDNHQLSTKDNQPDNDQQSHNIQESPTPQAATFTPIAPLVTWADSYGADPTYVELLGFPNSPNYQRVQALDFVIITDVWDYPQCRYFARIEAANINLPLLGLSRENPTRIVTQDRYLRGMPTPSTLGECVHLFRAKIITCILDGVLLSPRTRPNWNSPARLATSEEIIDNLFLPVLNPDLEIGVII